jgi:hypothetical protein
MQMMVFTTLFVAAIIVLGLYFFIIRFTPWPALSYALMVGVGVACLFAGDIHFRYVGIEVAGLGSILVWVHYQFIQKPAPQSPKREA